MDKKTSATGILRLATEPNIPFQDLKTEKLLCYDCEQRFSRLETFFATNIFYPYVKEELDEYGCAQGKIKQFAYDEQLLKFVLSVQWRAAVTVKNSLSAPLQAQFQNSISNWRKFLLDEADNSGPGLSYLVFMQNLAAAEGDLSCMPDQINHYVLRSCDGTPVIMGSKEVFMYSKIGPLAMFTAIQPHKIKNISETRIKIHGKISTVQRVMNSNIGQWMYITRPKEALSHLKFSANQKSKIAEKWKNPTPKMLESMTVKMTESDVMMKRGYKLIKNDAM